MRSADSEHHRSVQGFCAVLYPYAAPPAWPRPTWTRFQCLSDRLRRRVVAARDGKHAAVIDPYGPWYAGGAEQQISAMIQVLLERGTGDGTLRRARPGGEPRGNALPGGRHRYSRRGRRRQPGNDPQGRRLREPDTPGLLPPRTSQLPPKPPAIPAALPKTTASPATAAGETTAAERDSRQGHGCDLSPILCVIAGTLAACSSASYPPVLCQLVDSRSIGASDDLVLRPVRSVTPQWETDYTWTTDQCWAGSVRQWRWLSAL